MKGRGDGDAMKLQTSGLARRGPDGKMQDPVMYKCKDRRKGSAGLPSSVGWFGSGVKGTECRQGETIQQNQVNWRATSNRRHLLRER